MTTSHHEEKALGLGGDKHLVRRLLRYLRPYRKYALISGLLAFLNAPLMLIAPPLTKAAVDLFIVPDASRPLASYELVLKRGADFLGLGGDPYHGLIFIALIFLSANLLGFAVQYVHSIVMQMIGQYVMFDLRQEIFGHFQRLPIQFHDRNPVGRLMTRLTSDVDALNEMFTTGITSVIRNLIAIVYITIWMLYINWRMTLLTFAMLPLIIVLTILCRNGARTATARIRVLIARINAFLQEHISGMLIVQLFNREECEKERFESINEDNRREGVKSSLYYSSFLPVAEVVGVIGIALILWRGGLQVISGAATLGTLIAFIQLARSFYEPVSEISDKYNVLQAAMAAAERVFALLDEPLTKMSTAKPGDFGEARGKIEFRNVWFAYNDEDWVLKDLSFTVEPGERIAFVGHTGAGKTTITSLLLRFYDIQRGQILFDDTDIREYDLTDLRSNFSIVLQDMYIYAGDIASNIRFNNKAISDDHMMEAARSVHADHFIKKLPDGYATQVHERGNGLSVGQKQLLSFARALAFNPRVLILDEATSSIDTETEILIRQAMERLMKGRTSLAVAHRLSTIQSVDKIIVIHKGRVREMGTHQQLLNERGFYWRLYQLQFAQKGELPRLDEAWALIS
jgi:ATP-binding cassette, subfamily B, multidrug efflux pump